MRNYRKATDLEFLNFMTCEFCIHSREREESGRLECTQWKLKLEGQFVCVGKNSKCDECRLFCKLY